MLLSSGATRRAAAELRELASELAARLAELTDPRTWHGSDANRLGEDWRSRVTSELLAAADDLDGIEFEELLTVLSRTGRA